MRNTLRWGRLGRLILPACTLAVLAACGDDRGAVGEPVFAVDPSSLSFSAGSLGTTESQFIEISNAADEGQGDLVLRSLSIVAPQSGDLDWCGGDDCAVFQVLDFETGENFAGEVFLAPGERRTYEVRYYSQTTDTVTGELRFQTNARQTNRGEVEDGIGTVTLSAAALEGRLFVSPDPINFGRVPAEANEEVCIDVSVSNIGNANLGLTNYDLVGGAGQFRIDDGGDFGSLLAAAGGETLVLGPGDEILVPMCFLPQDNDTAQASFLVDLVGGTRENIDVIGNGAEPCLDISFENGYDFGLVPANETRSTAFTITNCAPIQNGETLVVDTLELMDDDEFSPLSYGLANVPQLNIELEPGESTAFEVQCTPEEVDVIYQGALLVESNDSLKPSLEIPLNCTGSDLTPPECVVECRITGTDAWQRELLVQPLDTIECTAQRSTDADGYIISWEWDTEVRPGGSVTQFSPRAAETSSLFVDFSGRYEVSAVCTDDTGLTNTIPCDSDGDRVPDPAGCERAGIECPESGGTFDFSACDAARTDKVTVLARPDDDIQVELAWSTPADADETDVGFNAGSDVDLHVLHPNGCWNDPTWDCYFGNTAANWGDVGSREDDAELDRDDTDGAGPETISIDSPEDGATYRIGVHYYNDHRYGTSYASVRVYVFGILQAEYLDQELPATDYWWEVATVSWPSGAVTPIGNVFPSEPPCN